MDSFWALPFLESFWGSFWTVFGTEGIGGYRFCTVFVPLLRRFWRPKPPGLRPQRLEASQERCRSRIVSVAASGGHQRITGEFVAPIVVWA